MVKSSSDSKAASPRKDVRRPAVKTPMPLPPDMASATLNDAAPKTKKEAALQRALAATIGRTSGGLSSALSEPDAYGKGSPTDRLQFGYSPAITEEAVAFHSRTTAASWAQQRRANYHAAIVKRQRLPRANCEPMLSVLKLKNHWGKVSQFRSGLRGDHITNEDADELLEMLAAKQRVEPA